MMLDKGDSRARMKEVPGFNPLWHDESDFRAMWMH